MSDEEITVPFLSNEEIWAKAESFLHTYNTEDEFPIPIEKIIEFKLGVDIIPIHELSNAFNIDGFISNDFSSITVDLNLMGRYENRYRFTLAHEIGHMILHQEIYNQMEFSSTEEWQRTITTFNAIQYGYMETQANKFAGLVLVPKYFLKKKYEEAVSKVENQGFDMKKNHEIFNQYVCRWLGQEFNVADKVIKIRLEADDLV